MTTYTLPEKRDFAFTLLELTIHNQMPDADLETIQSWLSNQPASDRRDSLMKAVDLHLNPIELKWEAPCEAL